MPDLEKILRLVAEGAISPEEADELLSRLETSAEGSGGRGPRGGDEQREEGMEREGGRRLRIEVHEGGRRVVNLSVPINVASLAGSFLPGLSEEVSERIQSALRSGLRGPIVDVSGDGGDRVLIVSD